MLMLEHHALLAGLQSSLLHGFVTWSVAHDGRHPAASVGSRAAVRGGSTAAGTDRFVHISDGLELQFRWHTLIEDCAVKVHIVAHVRYECGTAHQSIVMHRCDWPGCWARCVRTAIFHAANSQNEVTRLL